jgi:hypothetical protein
MPIIRSSDQKNKTLEEFYKELTSENATVVENEIGKAMLEFISMVNETLKNSTLFGLTSHYSLVIQATDNWEDGWFVTVYSFGDNKFQLEYNMSENKSPWNYAIVKGQANTVSEAKDFLIIAMTESEGWRDNKELRKLYNKLKGRNTENAQFTLWLEFKEVDSDNWDIQNEFCNIHVDLEDGRHYGINVWTYKYLETAVNENKKTEQNLRGLYQIPPDLFVKELSRECIQQTIEDLLKIDDLEKVLNPSIYDKRNQK